MNDNNFSDMLKKAQEMINNNQVPEEIKEMATKLGSNGNLATNTTSCSTNNSSNSTIDSTVSNTSNADVSSTTTTTTTTNNNNNNNNNNAGFDFSNIDMATLMKFQGILSKLNSASDDDMSKLLFALKPYLRNEKKEKVDEYIKLARMGKMTELFDLLGRKN